jgi:chitodextrinase
MSDQISIGFYYDLDLLYCKELKRKLIEPPMKKLLQIIFTFIGLLVFSNAEAQVADSLHPNRGVAMIWYGGQGNIDSRNGVVTVGQIFYFWRFFEPTEGNYQFGDLDAQLQALKNKGLKTTIQINGNRHPDYLYQVIPYLDGVQLPTANDYLDGYGPLMYWHPVYKEKYANLVYALAAHIRASPYKDVVLAVRHNANAIGTEHHYIPPEYRDTTQWTRKPTATWSNEWPWTSQKANEYMTWTTDLYIDAFNPVEDIKLFMRASAISGSYAKARHIEMVEKGELWIFETSSEPQPRGGKENQYQAFVDYAKSGKTYAFMESWSEARINPGDEAWVKTKRPITKEQFNYWTLLVDLHCGATWPAMRPEDIDYPTFRKHYEFAAKYAGYIAAPKKTPGAWIAFREGDKLVGDYTFLMKRSSADNSSPLYNVDNAPEGLWARQISQGNSMALDLNPEFALSLANSQGVTFTITYKDVGTGDFRVNAFGQSFTHTCTGTGAWLKFTKKIDVGEITNFEITASGGALTLHMVEIKRGEMNRRGDIDPPTAPGNLLVTDTSQTSCSLIWSESADAVGVTGYLVYINDEYETTVTGTGTTILGLNCATQYSFSVKSRDAAGNLSESSNVVNAETLACPHSDVLYSENFDDNLAQDWSADSADKWSLANGKYSTVKGGLFTSIYHGLKFQNYIFKADAFPYFHNDFGVIFDFIDNDNHYIMILDADPKTARLVKVENGVSSIVATSTYTIGGFQKNHTIVVKNSGTEVLVTVNGTIVFNNIPITASDSAKIGLWVERNPVDFDNIEVLKNIDPDTIPPTKPTNLQVSNVNETSFDLSWDASSDNAGIGAYQVYRDNLPETVNQNNYLTINGLSCGKSYNFFIIAVDINNNLSDTSTVETFSTSECSDVMPPTAPAGLTTSHIEQNSVHLNWLPSNDNVAVTAYNVYLNNLFETAFFSTNGTIYGLDCGTTYTITVKARDAAGNLSDADTIEFTTVACIDDQSPSKPTGLSIKNTTQTSVEIQWVKSTDNIAVTGYNVFINNAFHATLNDTSITIDNLACGTTYHITLLAFDAEGNMSQESDVLVLVTSDCSDTIPPTAPANLTVSNITQTSCELSWDASTDNLGVTEYDVFIDGTPDTTVTVTSVLFSNLECNTTYHFTVKAKDAAGNVSEASSIQEVTTINCDVGVHKNLYNDHISIYPVPFKDELNIEFSGVNGQVVVNLYNALGVKVYSKPIHVTENALLTINNMIKPGFYYLQIEQNNFYYYFQVTK